MTDTDMAIRMLAALAGLAVFILVPIIIGVSVWLGIKEAD